MLIAIAFLCMYSNLKLYFWAQETQIIFLTSRCDVWMISHLWLIQQYWSSLPLLEILLSDKFNILFQSRLTLMIHSHSHRQSNISDLLQISIGFSQKLSVLRCMILHSILMVFYSSFCTPNQVIQFLLIFWSSVLVILY